MNLEIISVFPRATSDIFAAAARDEHQCEGVGVTALAPMSSTIGSGSLETASEGSGDEDELSVDSEAEQSSDEETAATQTRPASAPEPAAPMDLSVIRELSERMDASLARLLLRYPPTYSVDPGIDRYFCLDVAWNGVLVQT